MLRGQSLEDWTGVASIKQQTFSLHVAISGLARHSSSPHSTGLSSRTKTP